MTKYYFPPLITFLTTLTACPDDPQVVGAAEAGGATAGFGSATGATESDGQLDGTGGETTTITDGNESGGAACQEQQFDITQSPAPAQVMLLLDKSGSMGAAWDHDGDPQTATVTRWNSLYHVVGTLTANLGQTFQFGAQLFPAADAYLDEPVNMHSCKMNPFPEVAVGSNTVDDIMATLPPPDEGGLAGGTPATAAVTQAVKHLNNVQTAPGAPAPNQALVLVTDGAANCDPSVPADETLFTYDERLVNAVADAFEFSGIPTYVVGIAIQDSMGTKPEVNTFESLTDVALSGGAPKSMQEPFYNANNEDELMTALETIGAKVSCTVSFDSEPHDPDDVRVTIGGKNFGRMDDCSTGHGWAYTSPGGPYQSIELCGQACDLFQVEQTLNVEFYCE